jgi:hypothetical protein
MDFDDIIPILGIVASILGLIFRDKKKEHKKGKNKIENKKDSPKELSYIEKFKDMRNSLKEELSSALEDSKKDAVKSKESNDHELRLENDKKVIDQNEREDNLTFEMPVKRKKMAVSEEIKDVIHENEIGKETLVLNKKNIIKGIILSEILQKPKSLR